MRRRVCQDVAGGKMKDTILWESPNTGATNSSGFKGLPGGLRSAIGVSHFIEKSGVWWSSTVSGKDGIWLFLLDYNSNSATRFASIEQNGFSVRCIRDSLANDKEMQTSANYYNMGDAKFDLTKYREALGDYTKAIELEPGFARAYLRRGVTKAILYDYPGAIKDYNKAIELNQIDAEAYLQRGTAKYQIKDYTGAVMDYNKAIQLRPTDARVYALMGITKTDLKDYKGALQDCNKAIALEPYEGKTYFIRGLAKKALLDEAGACLDFKKAAELKTPHAAAYLQQYCN